MRSAGRTLLSLDPARYVGTKWPSYKHSTILPRHGSSRAYHIDGGDLRPCDNIAYRRPKLVAQSKYSQHARSELKFIASQSRALGAANDIWSPYLRQRFESTNLPLSDYGMPWQRPNRMSIHPDHEIWNSPAALRAACKSAFEAHFSPRQEIEARKLCTEVKDPTFPTIYHSLKEQAQILYVLGRLELERHVQWRPLAWFMLSISAGLGQLDAALLLHQLQKVDNKCALQEEQKSVIEKAARDALDWRAMVAHWEIWRSKAKDRAGRAVHPQPELEDCLDRLLYAMELAKPVSGFPVERITPPEGYIDVDKLEIFDPPYKLLLDITSNELSGRKTWEGTIEYYERAAREGSLKYQDPNAAWLYACHILENGRAQDEQWVESVQLAAISGNAEACFTLANHYLRRDGWYPSLAARVEDNIQYQLHQNTVDNRAVDDLQYQGLSDQEIHDIIISEKDEKLLDAQDGFWWMKGAAQLHIDSAAKMLNRFCIVAGLLRQNGFVNEGRQALLEAHEHLRGSIDNPSETATALRTLDEYIEHWDRPVQTLLTTEQISTLLEM